MPYHDVYLRSVNVDGVCSDWVKIPVKDSYGPSCTRTPGAYSIKLDFYDNGQLAEYKVTTLIGGGDLFIPGVTEEVVVGSGTLSGKSQTVTVGGLQPKTKYSISVKDAAGNWTRNLLTTTKLPYYFYNSAYSHGNTTTNGVIYSHNASSSVQERVLWVCFENSANTNKSANLQDFNPPTSWDEYIPNHSYRCLKLYLTSPITGKCTAKGVSDGITGSCYSVSIRKTDDASWGGSPSLVDKSRNGGGGSSVGGKVEKGKTYLIAFSGKDTDTNLNYFPSCLDMTERVVCDGTTDCTLILAYANSDGEITGITQGTNNNSSPTSCLGIWKFGD